MEKLQGLVDQHPEVRFSLYVDDAVQICIGAAVEVAFQLSMAACHFVVLARLLGLEISTRKGKESAVMGSCKLITNEVKRRLCVLLPRLKVVLAGRDLGVMLSATKRRASGVLHTRLKATKPGLYRIRRLCRLGRRSRKLTTTGAVPAALWGVETLGLAPPQ